MYPDPPDLRKEGRFTETSPGKIELKAALVMVCTQNRNSCESWVNSLGEPKYPNWKPAHTIIDPAWALDQKNIKTFAFKMLIANVHCTVFKVCIDKCSMSSVKCVHQWA